MASFFESIQEAGPLPRTDYGSELPDFVKGKSIIAGWPLEFEMLRPRYSLFNPSLATLLDEKVTSALGFAERGLLKQIRHDCELLGWCRPLRGPCTLSSCSHTDVARCVLGRCYRSGKPECPVHTETGCKVGQQSSSVRIYSLMLC
jgi:hypothetical protein